MFAGQRADGFYVDLGSIFDLGILRPFEADHNLFGIVGSGIGGSPPGVNATKALNVHSIAIQVPMNQLTANGAMPSDATSSSSVIGVWTTASRQKVQVREWPPGDGIMAGPWVQVSRLGNPLVNEVIIPLVEEGLLEQPAAGGRQPVRAVRVEPRAGPAAPGPVPRRVPEPRRRTTAPPPVPTEPTWWRSC